jgi:hypothetical protein
MDHEPKSTPEENRKEDQSAVLLREIRDHLAEKDEPLIKLLKRIATFLIPSGLIGVIGQLSGFSAASTAAISLAIFCLLFLWHYKLSIQIRIRTWMVLATFVIVTTCLVVFRHSFSAFLLERSITKATGIVDYAPHANEYLPKVAKLMEGARHDIWICGVSFYISLPQYRGILLKKLQDGVDIRFLVYDPLSASLAELATGFSQTPEELRAECITTIENLRGLIMESRNQRTKGSIEVRLFSSAPRTRLYVVDQNSDAGYTFFIPHVDQRNSAQLPGFLARNTKDGVAFEYFSGMERMWSLSRRWDAFIQEFDGLKANSNRPVP